MTKTENLDILADALAVDGYYVSFKYYPLVTLDGSFTLEQLACFLEGWQAIEEETL